MKKLEFEEFFLEDSADLFKALGHPSRLCILYNLIEKKEGTVSEMQSCLNEPQSTVSQHVAKLRTLGIIRGDRNGTEINYKIVNERVVEILKILRKNKGE
ncbi:MAG: metalloregulator ArsR/SmtB family transcription factor [Bacillota bacterium]|nr:metalloregulator ArsR/SmtB family transcription factor [Bacillota bacterium]